MFLLKPGQNHTTFNDPRNITVQQFQNPDDLLGKRFMLSLETDNVDYWIPQETELGRPKRNAL